MMMDTEPTRYEKPEIVASQPSSASAQDAAELDASGVYEMDAGNNVWPGDGHERTSPRLYRPIQKYGREDGLGAIVRRMRRNTRKESGESSDRFLSVVGDFGRVFASSRSVGIVLQSDLHD
jgi:hypothetical protein